MRHDGRPGDPRGTRSRSAGRVALALVIALGSSTVLAATARQPFQAEDILAVRDVSSPAISPDGQWVAYVTTVNDAGRDEQNSDLWMASWDGTRNLQLTRSAASESQPGWSPDGRYLAFVAARARPGDTDEDDATEQVWLFDRAGGEPSPVTDFPGDVVEYAWAPDGRHLAVVAWDPDPAATDADATPKPIVIDRYYFMEDYTGYLDARRTHLYVVDIVTHKAERVTESPYDESYPAWSGDGRLAFLGREGADPDRDSRYTLFVAQPLAGKTVQRLAGFQGESGDSDWMSGPVWSPDSRSIALTAGGDPKLIYYSTHRVFVIDAAGGQLRPLASGLDRNMMAPRWTADGRGVYVLLEDDGNQELARIDLASDEIRPVTAGRREVVGYDLGADGRIAILESTTSRPYEVYALENDATRPLSRQNDAWLAGRQIADVEETRFRSRDGTEIHGFLLKPPGFRAGQRYPAILRIHGGPVMQYANSFMIDWQILASAGYVVIAANPRGSSGRGQDFATAIYADWGHKDSEDVLAAVDAAVASGLADPTRLGVGGWSYGGMLTDQVIARDQRFKAATSGASLGNALAGYGTDMYVREYEAELGVPWENLDAYLRVSYPFLNAGRIVTPTLFLCGERDMNVPLLNSEQMYQALRSRGVDTELVIYPGEYHGFDVPSYVLDRMQRYLDWYGRYLGQPPGRRPRSAAD
jgi:dipeptidyl aminopeptidase/acylaminoacyl peptidase